MQSGRGKPLKATDYFTDVFWYVIDFIDQNAGVNIAAGATVQGVLNTEQASDFVWVKTMFSELPLGTTFTELKVKRDPDCPICGRDAPDVADEDLGKFPDYEAFCSGVAA